MSAKSQRIELQYTGGEVKPCGGFPSSALKKPGQFGRVFCLLLNSFAGGYAINLHRELANRQHRGKS